LKRENFLFDLALVACEMGTPIGGCSAPDKTKIKPSSDMPLKKKAYRMYFDSVLIAVGSSRFKPFYRKKDKIEFVFDENQDPSWQQALSETFEEYKHKGAAFDICRPGNDEKCLPLQAADLYVYAMRQNGERFFVINKMQPAHASMLDFILEKNRPDVENWTFTENEWAKLVILVVNHYRDWKLANPKKKYFPLLNCPLLQPPGN
jgi:hypothetical protein